MAKILPGGWSETKDTDEDIQKICDQVKILVEKFTGKNYEVYRAVKYRKQIVNGENYLIKVFVGVEDYIHVMVFLPPPNRRGEDWLRGVEQRRSRGDPLEPFVN